MKSVSILPADVYLVTNKSLLNDNDRLVLTMLYQPIVGSVAISLYLTLWSNLNKDVEEYTHHYLMNVMNLKLDDIVSSRKKLEAIGLLKTYYKSVEGNNYIYELYSPLSPSEFFSNPILASSLLSIVGRKEYQRIINMYKLNRINLNGYENITSHFSDVFMMSIKNIEDVTEKDTLAKEKLDIMIEEIVDFNFILSGMPKVFNPKSLTPSLRKLINSLAYLYNFDNVTLLSILKDSLNEKGLIDEKELKKNCKNYYSFENNSAPKLIYKSRNNIKPNIELKDLKKKMIECFECNTPYNFLKAKYGGSKPTNRDISLIESLLVDQELNPGVVNVLVDYVLRTNNNKLNKNLIEAIASQWKMSNINTVKEAMVKAEEEYKKINLYKNKQSSTKEIHKETLPAWYGKNIKREEMSQEEINELQDLLSEFE